MPGIRSFVAVELDDAARRELARLEDQLRGTGADVKWVAPASLHLTLKFLGDVPAGDLPAVTRALGEALEGVAPFALVLSGLGAFPSVSGPRVVWVGVAEGRETLAGLASRIEMALEPLGFPRESRGFSPHLTLGRCRSSRGVAELKAALVARKDFRGPRIAVDRVMLLSSELRPAGPVYAPLAVFAL